MFGSSFPRPHSLPTRDEQKKSKQTSERVDTEVDESRHASLEPLDLLLSRNGKFGFCKGYTRDNKPYRSLPTAKSTKIANDTII